MKSEWEYVVWLRLYYCYIDGNDRHTKTDKVKEKENCMQTSRVCIRFDDE